MTLDESLLKEPDEFLLKEPKILSPDEIIQQSLDEGHKNLYCLCSGGKDSIATTHYIKENFPNQFKGGVYTVTGVGVNEARTWVVDYFKEMGWPLQFTWTPISFTDIVLEHGFPSPDQHNIIMFQLKFITWRYFEREHRKKDMIFVGGIRRKESKRRKKRYLTPFQADGKTHFVNPFLYYSGIDIWDYHAKHDLKLTPVHDILNISGDCLCGCFGEKWELKLIERYYPRMFNYIQWLEQQIQIRGSVEARKYPTWAHGKHRKALSTSNVISQTLLESFDQSNLGNVLCSESCGVGDYQ